MLSCAACSPADADGRTPPPPSSPRRARLFSSRSPSTSSSLERVSANLRTSFHGAMALNSPAQPASATSAPLAHRASLEQRSSGPRSGGASMPPQASSGGSPLAPAAEHPPGGSPEGPLSGNRRERQLSENGPNSEGPNSGSGGQGLGGGK